MPKFTKRFVDTLKPDGSDRFVWDEGLTGFGIRVKPSGTMSYLIQYRTPRGQTRRLTLGKVGTLTPDEARELARSNLALVAKGEDPAEEKREARTAITVAELCEAYMEAARAGRVMTRFKKAKRPSTVAIDEGRINRHIAPLIGSLVANDLTRSVVQKMSDDIIAGKTEGTFKTGPRGKAVVTGGPLTAARVVELFGGIWTWANRRGLVSGESPTKGVEKARPDPSDRVLTPAELRKLGKVLVGRAETNPQAVAALRLIALTGLRREEACGLRWEEVDAEASCLRLKETKTGRSMRPIGRAALDLLASLPKHPSGWVFPNRTGSDSADMKKAIAALLNEAGLTDARSHDLRRTFASVAAELGYGDATIGEMLGHARRGVTVRYYIRRPDTALVAGADNVSASIAEALGLPLA